MLNKIIKPLSLIPFFCGLLFIASVEAKQPLPLDAVVIMDSSGSMKQTDPKQLRKPAAKLFISLLGKKDKLSVMSFSSKGWPIRIGQSKEFLTLLSTDRIKDNALKATDKISHKGIHTNIHAALLRGIELVKNSQQQNRDPILVLMSDGQMDVGNRAQSKKLREQVVSELIPQLKEYGIKVYSIAFTQKSDQQLLQQVAEETDGRYALAESDDVLHKVFARMFEQSKKPNMLPLTENKFLVDASIREITIIANKKDGNSKIFLETPKAIRHNAKKHNKNMKWFESTSFDMITLSKPEEGEWKILFSDDDNKAYIVADMQLRSEFEYNEESTRPELIIKTWLMKDDKVLTNDEIISNIELSIEIEDPEQNLQTLYFSPSEERGVFEIFFKPSVKGMYSATVIASSKTFQRQQFFSFRAHIPEDMPIEEEIIEQAVVPEAVVEAPIEIAEIPPEETIEEEPENDIMQALMLFVVGNLILISLAGGGYFGYRFLQKKKLSGNSKSK